MLNAVIGGVLIGIAVSLMLLFNGRVTGISGILGGIVKPQRKDLFWRIAFILGLIFGGIIIQLVKPSAFFQTSSVLRIDYVIAGLLVGFGTLLGNGCTSGHGVCGISRLSVRSIIATITFITFGVISVLIFKFVRGTL